MRNILLCSMIFFSVTLQGMEASHFSEIEMYEYLSTAGANIKQRAVSMHYQTAGAEDYVRAKNDLKHQIDELLRVNEQLLFDYPEYCDRRKLLQSYLALNAAIDSWHQGTSAADYKRAKEILTDQFSRCWEGWGDAMAVY
jgi:hypothetical protein